MIGGKKGQIFGHVRGISPGRVFASRLDIASYHLHEPESSEVWGDSSGMNF